MYIVIDKTTNESAVIKEKTTLAKYLGVSRSTVQRNSGNYYWKQGNFNIFEPSFIDIKSKRGKQ